MLCYTGSQDGGMSLDSSGLSLFYPLKHCETLRTHCLTRAGEKKALKCLLRKIVECHKANWK